MDDRKLVNDFLHSRSEKAFRTLYRSKTPHLYRMALRLTQNDTLSEELIQETWMVAIRKLAEFEWRSELKTWLVGILINLSRKKRKETESLEALEEAELTQASPIVDESWSITSMDLEAGIAKLPPGYRQIIVLHDIEGYKHKEIAELLDITEGTSKSQLFYARKALREYLSEDSKAARK
jgi:RNA polymerase sigma factor (sigma-70 family)